MLDYYDTIYRQAIKKLQNRSTRSYNEKDENIIDFSCAIITRENRDGTIEYQLVESSSIICATNQIKQRTDIITIQVDTHKLSNSYYLLKYADSLTYNLCNASIYDYTN